MTFSVDSIYYVNYFQPVNSPGDPIWPYARSFDSLFNNDPYSEWVFNQYGFQYSFFHLTNSMFFDDGNFFSGSNLPDTPHYIPPRPWFEFPFTLGSHWTYVSRRDTSELYEQITWDSIIVDCDAFGSLVVNNGISPVSYPCLRVTTIDFSATQNIGYPATYHNVVNYDYYTKAGVQVEVTADTSSLGESTIHPYEIDVYYLPGSAAVAGPEAASPAFVYPNPASNELHVVGANGTACIVDPLGRALEVPREGDSFDVSRLANGIYFLRDAAGLRKFAIER